MSDFKGELNMYKFEWNFKTIKDQKSFEKFVEDMLKEENPYFKFPSNYEQAATLLYKDDNTGYCVAIELQVPTNALVKLLDGEVYTPWLDGYEIDNINELYDADREIESMWNKKDITFDNAEQLMLALAKKLCNE